jgi:hypothetical protein
VLVALVAAVAALVLVLTSGTSPEEEAADVAGAAAEVADAGDVFTWEPSRDQELSQRAATGTSHVLYALSPGGVIETAQRVNAWRQEIERAAARHDVDPDRLEAMVFLESAGRDEVIAGQTPEAATGLAQIIPSTATDLLGMRVDLAESIKLTRQIAKAVRKGEGAMAKKLRAERARVDERFDPQKALDGAGLYLEKAERRFGDPDLATVSYHMGIGNLKTVIDAYGEGDDVSYPQLFFGSAPDDHAEAYDILSGFADDSSLYLWRVLASERIMHEWRSDRAGLERDADLATAKATLEELYHPEGSTEIFDTPDDVSAATDEGTLLPLPDDPDLGWVPDKEIGELAKRLDVDPETYRALRPEALATLSWMGARVAELSHAKRPLRVTSAVRDRSYQELLTRTRTTGRPQPSSSHSTA